MANYTCEYTTKILRTKHKVGVWGTAGSLIESLKNVPSDAALEIEEDDNGKTYLTFIVEKEDAKP